MCCFYYNKLGLLKVFSPIGTKVINGDLCMIPTFVDKRSIYTISTIVVQIELVTDVNERTSTPVVVP